MTFFLYFLFPVLKFHKGHFQKCHQHFILLSCIWFWSLKWNWYLCLRQIYLLLRQIWNFNGKYIPSYNYTNCVVGIPRYQFKPRMDHLSVAKQTIKNKTCICWHDHVGCYAKNKKNKKLWHFDSLEIHESSEINESPDPWFFRYFDIFRYSRRVPLWIILLSMLI